MIVMKEFPYDFGIAGISENFLKMFLWQLA
jgi:hypothetical protein